jgi:hypothetical protein
MHTANTTEHPLRLPQVASVSPLPCQSRRVTVRQHCTRSSLAAQGARRHVRVSPLRRTAAAAADLSGGHSSASAKAHSSSSFFRRRDYCIRRCAECPRARAAIAAGRARRAQSLSGRAAHRRLGVQELAPRLRATDAVRSADRQGAATAGRSRRSRSAQSTRTCACRGCASRASTS